MTADTALDLAGIALGLAFITLMIGRLAATAWWGERATLRQLTRIVHIATAAAAVGVANIVVQVASIPFDGPVWPLLWVLTTGLSVAVLRQARRRRSAKGDQVLAEAERTVRDYLGPMDGGRDAQR